MAFLRTAERRIGSSLRSGLALLRHPFFWGLAAGVLFLMTVRAGNAITSTDSFCESCHIHPQATVSWKQSTHFATKSGTVVHCVECHLPPGGFAYGVQKARLGIRDTWGKLTKDPDSFDWEARSDLAHARTFTFRESCLDCHPNLFPLQLSDKGEEAHFHYERQADEIRCLNCHLHVGHFDPDATDEIDFGIVATVEGEIFDAAATVEGFVDYTERIPGTSVSFDMIAVPGGSFEMGSPETEGYREGDEGPRHQVTLGPFWMARVETTWNEFEAWYRATLVEGRTDTRRMEEEPSGAAAGGEGRTDAADVDALTGATPPYVPPDQGWGKGDRPAITMTHHAAVQYTRWLSQVTGKRYRLPTEAEWEYAARGGTGTPYFFEGEPSDYTAARFLNRVFGPNTEVLDRYSIHRGNSGARTQSPSDMEPNPFGLVNMLGNVKEFTSDWYAEDTYGARAAAGPVQDPVGPESGTEHVIRGGSFRSDPAALRVAARDHTRTGACLVTDPQIPKSLWWYSDCDDIGFRVVREFEDSEQQGAER
ncbi:MAG: SUMF1/EgtB/PvdO family nonheme iron enzyme [Gemmatimonadetes bacterium]|nr:SUMF1/EgtB/PvdO family nonheme iron enzyme [Gemmatimonadota bacterium]NNM03953.1 SUMF1/EgtB/PvdO family nonheme iron enzyme [Gemmatimonadota bacterium]